MAAGLVAGAVVGYVGGVHLVGPCVDGRVGLAVKRDRHAWPGFPVSFHTDAVGVLVVGVALVPEGRSGGAARSLRESGKGVVGMRAAVCVVEAIGAPDHLTGLARGAQGWRKVVVLEMEKTHSGLTQLLRLEPSVPVVIPISSMTCCGPGSPMSILTAWPAALKDDPKPLRPPSAAIRARCPPKTYSDVTA